MKLPEARSQAGPKPMAASKNQLKHTSTKKQAKGQKPEWLKADGRFQKPVEAYINQEASQRPKARSQSKQTNNNKTYTR